MVVFFVKSNENTYPKLESTHANVQGCPYNEKRELKPVRHSDCFTRVNIEGLNSKMVLSSSLFNST